MGATPAFTGNRLGSDGFTLIIVLPGRKRETPCLIKCASICTEKNMYLCVPESVSQNDKC